MTMLRFLTAGESHGPCLTAIIDGIPAGLTLSVEDIDADLRRRQAGFGRGGRMKIEADTVTIMSGVRNGVTIGSPISLMIQNKDYKNWLDRMPVGKTKKTMSAITTPRPGHADFAGYMKYGFDDIRNVIERASARETAARTAVGSVAKVLLSAFDIKIGCNVLSIGGIEAEKSIKRRTDPEKADISEVRCLDETAGARMVEEIERAGRAGDTVGGEFEVVVFGAPPGLGSYVQWDTRLDGRIAAALMSIPAIKGVGIGEGFGVAGKKGSEVHDEMSLDGNKKIKRATNRAGGLEGGITNGEVIRVTAAMKPIPTLKQPLKTVDLKKKREASALKERSDVCAVPSAAVVGESVVAIEIARAFIEKFGGDGMRDVKKSYDTYTGRLGLWKRT